MSEPKSYVAKRGYAGIRRRLLFLLLLLAMTPLLALGLFCYDRLGVLYDEKLAMGLESVTNSKHRALDTFLAERVSQVRTLAFTHSYAELSDPARLSAIFSVMQAHSRSFADMGIIGMDGRHAAYVGPFDLRTADYTSAEWFQAVLRRGVYVSDVFMGYRNVPHFIIAVLRHEGNRSFILRATIDMEAIGALLLRLYSASSKEDFIIHKKGSRRLRGTMAAAWGILPCLWIWNACRRAASWWKSWRRRRRSSRRPRPTPGPPPP